MPTVNMPASLFGHHLPDLWTLNFDGAFDPASWVSDQGGILRDRLGVMQLAYASSSTAAHVLPNQNFERFYWH